MSSSFCIWAPWVFAALAGLAAWLLRWWYDDRQFDAYKSIIKTREEDIYHLNEAHNLLLEDKEKKLYDAKVASDMKEKVINELNQKLEQAETSNKTLLSKIVDAKKKSSAQLVGAPAPTAVVAHKENVTGDIHNLLQTSDPDDDVRDDVARDKGGKKKKSGDPKSKKTWKKKKSKKLIRTIQKLGAENEQLKNKLSSKKVRVIKITKEIPVKITKTILHRERVDKKKIKKYIKYLPLKKSKKVLRKKRKTGKPRIIKKS